MPPLKSGSDTWLRDAERQARRDMSRRAFLAAGAGASTLLLAGDAEAGKERIRHRILSKRGGYWAENRPAAGTARSLPTRLFPADNWWNTDISAAPLDTDSATYMAGMAGVSLSAIFDENDGYSWATVSGNHPKVSFAHCATLAESDMVPIPIPLLAITQRGWTENVGISPALNETLSGGQDRHLIVVDVDNNILYELYEPYYNATGSTVVIGGLNGPHNVLPGEWYSYSISVWDMDTNTQRTDGWTSSNASGMQVLPGCVSYDELVSGNPITHAHGICLNFGKETAPYWVWPARHSAAEDSPTHPPFGARLRLKSSFNLSSFRAETQRLGQAWKTYGMYFVDNSSNGDVIGLNDARWGDYYLGAGGLTWNVQQLMNAMTLGSHWELVQLGYGAP